VPAWASSRLLYLDNLKVVLIAAIIAGHGVIGYATESWWLYSDVREVTLSPVTEALLLVVAMPFALFLIPLLFLVAGLLTPPSLERKGTKAYVRDRLLRLGVPFAAFVLLWPLLEYVLFRPLGAPTGNYWDRLLDSEEPLQSGVLWFVGTLLVFSLAYAAWCRVRQGRAPRNRRDRVTLGGLLLLAGAVTVATFIVRLDIPFDSDKYVALGLYQWPECVALFGLGIAAARMGWLAAVPDRLRRQCRTATLVTAAAFGLFAGYGATSGGLGEETWGGGWHWEAFAFAALVSALSVCGPVWLLAVAQRYLNRRLRQAGPAVSRSAYGAFLMQSFVLVGIAVALRPLPVAAEVKALVVATGGIAGSFALAWLLISRVPGVRRVL
jgi:hypothetical protein